MAACRECDAELPPERSVVAAPIEEAFARPEEAWCCPGCLAFVWNRGGKLVTAVPGSRVARTVEKLRRETEEDRLLADLEGIARDHLLWPIARCPEVFALMGIQPGRNVRVIDSCDFLLRNFRFESGILCRLFDGMTPPRRIEPARRFQVTQGWLAGAELRVVAVSRPTVTLSYMPMPGRSSFERLGVEKLLTYADAVVPVARIRPGS